MSKSKNIQKVSLKRPTAAQEVSSNWKALQTSLQSKDRPLQTLHKKKTNIVSKPPKKVTKPNIWFDDVDPELLDPEDRPYTNGCTSEILNAYTSDKGLVKSKAFDGLTNVIGMDCEMVGVGYDGTQSILARVSIVNHFGKKIYDKYVKPTAEVTDYRTKVSGIRPQDIENGESFKVVQQEVVDIIKDRILVGHSLKHDLGVLLISHPRKLIRDTSAYKPFKAAFNGRTPSLRNLTNKFIGVQIQQGEHSSVQDAQAAIRLYTMHRTEWELSLKKRYNRVTIKKKNTDFKHGVTSTHSERKNGQMQYSKYVSSDSE